MNEIEKYIGLFDYNDLDLAIIFIRDIRKQIQKRKFSFLYNIKKYKPSLWNLIFLYKIYTTKEIQKIFQNLSLYEKILFLCLKRGKILEIEGGFKHPLSQKRFVDYKKLKKYNAYKILKQRHQFLKLRDYAKYKRIHIKLEKAFNILNEFFTTHYYKFSIKKGRDCCPDFEYIKVYKDNRNKTLEFKKRTFYLKNLEKNKLSQWFYKDLLELLDLIEKEYSKLNRKQKKKYNFDHNNIINVKKYFSNNQIEILYNTNSIKNIRKEIFVFNNKKFEKGLYYIKKWKEKNNFNYDSRYFLDNGIYFYHEIGAYSNVDILSIIQNLTDNINFIEKAGGEYILSTYLSKGEWVFNKKARIKIIPQPEDIIWIADRDIGSGSTWNIGQLWSWDDKSILGISYTKSPKVYNLGELIWNVYNIDLNKFENIFYRDIYEAGIRLTNNNWRLECNKNASIELKILCKKVNNYLNQKYGKLKKSKVKKINKQIISPIDTYEIDLYDYDPEKQWKINEKAMELKIQEWKLNKYYVI